MATMTYATLTQDLKDWMENDGTEFSNETDNFISLAEQRIARDIEPYAFHESANTTFNVGDRFISKPIDAKVIFHFLYIDSSGNRVFLEERTDEFIYDYWPKSSTTGTPVYWANYSDTAILVAPTPSAALSPEIMAAFSEPLSCVSPARKIFVVKRVSEGNISYCKLSNCGNAIGMLYRLRKVQESIPQCCSNSFIISATSASCVKL